MDSLIDIWGRRNPWWEKRYQDTIVNVFTNYGKGVDQFLDIRGKIFGAGYEIFILAFFIGLYHDGKKSLIEDRAKLKTFGQPIQYWGNIEERNGRHQYGQIRQYMFAALVAKTDIDFIALDKGEITLESVVSAMMRNMEEYANWGFDFMEEKLEQDPNYFFKDSAFLRVFLDVLHPENSSEENDEDEQPDDL